MILLDMRMYINANNLLHDFFVRIILADNTIHDRTGKVFILGFG